MTVPVAIFAYNRSRHIARALRALAACERFADVKPIVFCDAARRPEHAAAVAETRAVVRAWAARHGAEVVERTANLGLARSIAGSVGELVKAYGCVIVVEDDLVVAPDFLAFMLEGLERYADDDRIAQIAGTLLVDDADAGADALFLPLTTTWGWATWARAWTLFRWEEGVDLPALEADGDFRARFTLDGAYDYVAMLRDRLAGANDSWGILWWYAVARAGKLVLYPRRSLVWNGGFDNSGIHCQGSEDYREQAPEQFQHSRLGHPIAWPQGVAPAGGVLEAIKRSLRSQSGDTDQISAAPAWRPWSAVRRRLFGWAR